LLAAGARLFPCQQRRHQREPRFNQHRDHYRYAIELVYRDGFPFLRGYQHAFQRDQSRDLQPLSHIGDHQRHIGANIHADRSHYLLDDHGSLRGCSYRHFKQRF
jgi:hypothetical protein